MSIFFFEICVSISLITIEIALQVNFIYFSFTVKENQRLNCSMLGDFMSSVMTCIEVMRNL